MAILTEESLQILFERIDIRTQRHDPVGVERLLDKILLTATHLSQRQVNSLSHDYMITLLNRLDSLYYFTTISSSDTVIRKIFGDN